MTSLTLTPDPGTASVLVQITGAPTAGAAVYTGTFEAGTVDGWAAAGTGVAGATVSSSTVVARTGTRALRIDQTSQSGSTDTTTRVERVVTGLTVGLLYQVRGYAQRTYPSGLVDQTVPTVAFGVAGIGAAAPVTLSAGVWATVPAYAFTASATSHTVAAYYTRADTTNPTAWIGVTLDDLAVEPISAPFAALTITRTDANGVGPVRMLPDQGPAAGVLTVRDYEPALTGPTRYDVRDQLGVTTTAATAAGDLTVTAPVLHVPTLPALRVMLTPPGLVGYQAERDNAAALHDVIGRADPIVTIGPLGLRAGTLRVITTTHTDARALEALAARGEILMLRQSDHAGLDGYLMVRSTRVQPDQLVASPAGVTGWTWSVDLAFVEVARPSGPLLGSTGWTFGAVAATFATLADILPAYPTLDTLTVGPS